MVLVEILVWTTIVLVIASFVARVVYGRQMLAAEDRLVASLGISPDVHFVLKIVFAILGLCYLFSRYGPFRRTI
jgi:hypothetical protein